MTFFVPIKTVSEANTREHWRVKAKRVKAQRLAVLAAFPPFAKEWWPSPSKDRLVVTLVRFGKRLLDSDNLQSSFKAVRDQVAACLGRDDGPKSGIRWEYEQLTGPVPMVQIEIAADQSDFYFVAREGSGKASQAMKLNRFFGLAKSDA